MELTKDVRDRAVIFIADQEPRTDKLEEGGELESLLLDLQAEGVTQVKDERWTLTEHGQELLEATDPELVDAYMEYAIEQGALGGNLGQALAIVAATVADATPGDSLVIIAL